MGLTRRQSLTRVELPLAVPAIIAGVRVATVTTISLATVAAFITPLGLGAPIFSAIQTGANTEFVAASLLADRAGADRRRADRDPAAVPHAVGAGQERRPMSDLINFFTRTTTNLLLDRTLASTSSSRRSASSIALVIALPIGVWLGHLHRGSLLAINVSNVLRALPSLALIAISLAFIGLSRLNITIALVALADPADPHQRLHRGRRRRSGRGRVRARHGHERAPGPAGRRAAAVAGR